MIFNAWNGISVSLDQLNILAFGILSPFGFTYSCEQAFSCIIKRKLRNRFIDFMGTTVSYMSALMDVDGLLLPVLYIKTKFGTSVVGNENYFLWFLQVMSLPVLPEVTSTFLF